ncbi:hypothetical protein F1O51_08200 [Campylobacter coli]|uniref:hypothetical protein n=1 Tax=Campylobacter coli TaxID=195 RepID=UPI000E6CB593|nr:hypothetical protein [Campylobacter coli]ECL2591747.1 hypothetical protein [Campylobacter jejuni]EAL1630082.1 hypothetical protein [Campylobacter coli]ECK8374830.1 hypothetical protein [Campylobacter coli]ECL3525534.1 hypothetical protein [Campylobacter coli]ECP6411370.1 hypothetical protein [Campylobacter coli]
MKKYFLMTMVFLTCVSLNAADEFDSAVSTINSAETSFMSILGFAVRLVLGFGLPLGCMILGGYLGFAQAKRKAEQDQSTFKIFGVTAVCAVIGFFVFVVTAMLISSGLYGNSSYVFENVIYEFWKNAK